MKRLVVLSALLLSCAPKAVPAPAASGTPLHALAGQFWAEEMRASPTWATRLGDHSHDDVLDDNSETARLRHHDALTGFRSRLLTMNRGALSPQDRITADVLQQVLDSRLGDEACKGWLWTVDPLNGPQIAYADLPVIQKVTDEESLHDLTKRYRALKPWYETEVANLRSGLAQGYVTTKVDAERTLRDLDETLAVPPEKSSYMDAAKELPKEWSVERRDAATVEILGAVKDGVWPGLTLYRDFLRNEILPKARDAAVGVSNIPGGAACYAARIESETGLTKSPDEIHQLGLSEVARIRGEMLALAKKHGANDVESYWKTLQTDPKQYLHSADELLAHNSELLARAQAALPKAFGTLPKTPIVVHPLEKYKEKDSPAAYYEQAPTDGSRPAWYYVNTSEPASRPLYNMAALAFHESVPGHHLQIALQNENASLPEFQRQLGLTAFVEGWALYAEGLADELGLYANDEEEMGRLNYEAWRAVRLVVDTGMHSKGWSRQQALDYLLANTGHSKVEAENEIDRYITWPGQALAYKIGELEIRSMRAEAQQKLGPKFDLKAFHDRLLSHGAVPLPTARRDIEDWIKERSGPG
jgi:uncharacterized protein (DUF885 family)